MEDVPPGVRVRRLASKDPAPPGDGAAPAHWVGNPPASFRNPWPSYRQNTAMDMFRARFGPNRNLVPVPESRDELVAVRSPPDWGRSQPSWERRLKATWLGHAGFLVETSVPAGEHGHEETDGGGESGDIVKPPHHSSRRGITILFDAVFSERTSPVTFAGPKRYSPAPCSISELPDIDVIATSHNHYDHMDLVTIAAVVAEQQRRGRPPPHCLVALGNAHHLAGTGLRPTDITECDWWESVEVAVPALGPDAVVEVTCTPAQHASGRGVLDHSRALWCSWTVHDPASAKSLFFAGDTGYQTVGSPSPCPAFAQMGDVFGGFDLALLPIGLSTPAEFIAPVHCNPDASLRVHKDIKSRYSIGMHYGTFRGGISMHYEDVRAPPRRWKEVCETEGLWGSQCGLCDIGETVTV